MLSHKTQRQMDQTLAIILWHLCESLKLPPGNKRLQLYAFMKENPEEGRELVTNAVMELVRHMSPANELTLHALINGADGMGHMYHSLVSHYLGHMSGIVSLQLLPAWAGLGFPTVEMDLEFIHRLLRVPLSDGEIDSRPLPFEALEIALPEGLFSSKWVDGLTYSLHGVKTGYVLETFGNPGPPPVLESGYALLTDTDEFALWCARSKISEMGYGQNAEEMAEKDHEALSDEEDVSTMHSLVQIIGHVCRLSELKGGLSIPGDDILLPNFKERIMPSFTKRIFRLGPSDLPTEQG